MKKTINATNLHIKLWLDDLEEGAMEQALNLARLPFVFKHIAIMPDAHEGYGMPIGGVMATKGVVVPNAVGVDIGCGMRAIPTNIHNSDLSLDTLKKIMGKIRMVIPTGFNKHSDAKQGLIAGMPEISSNKDVPYYDVAPVVTDNYNNACKSLGTLGGGNHFIEIQKDEEGFIWIMIHSGSRNLGNQVATHYNKIAIEMNEKYFSIVPKHYKLAFLPTDSDAGQKYLTEMNYCVDYAKANRRVMMERIIDIFATNIPLFIPITEDQIDISHNYAVMEHHFGQNVLIHRKGATLAVKGKLGIIPGSQGTSSYIVEGKSNPESFNSCSHGSGRVMSRTKARKELNLQEEKKKLDDKNIIHAIRGNKDLDEASGAYKDIDTVMKNQEDLVKIIIKLNPIAVIKG